MITLKAIMTIRIVEKQLLLNLIDVANSEEKKAPKVEQARQCL